MCFIRLNLSQTYIYDHAKRLRLELYKQDPTVKTVIQHLLAVENGNVRSALRKLVHFLCFLYPAPINISSLDLYVGGGQDNLKDLQQEDRECIPLADDPCGAAAGYHGLLRFDGMSAALVILIMSLTTCITA